MTSKHRNRGRFARRTGFAAVLAAGIVGCSWGSTPADPQEAEHALQAALDAWQRGESAETLRERRPPIYVVDHEWRAGRKLVRYELAGAGQPAGNDQRCEAVLYFPDRRARPVAQKVSYSVGTRPALSVVREDQ